MIPLTIGKRTNNAALAWRAGILVVLSLTAISVATAQAAGGEDAVAAPRGSSVVAVASSHAFLQAGTPAEALRATSITAHALSSTAIASTDPLALKPAHVVAVSR